MAEPFSIIGVIGVACQIIQIGIEFGLDWKDAPADVKSFMTELQALKTTLSETNTNTALNQDFLDAFHGRHSALLSQYTDLMPSTDTSLMIGACQTELENLLAELKRRAKRHRVGWERMKGAFLAKKTRETVENLHRQCQILNRLVAIDSAALGATILKEAREDRKKRLDREAATQQGTVLNWLASVDFASQQNDFIRERRTGTGQWFLDSPKFQAWLQADNQTLFCPGIPGAGKTILSSIVVDELMTRFGNDRTIGIAYFYCNFQRQDKQKAEDVLESLLKQLAEGQYALPESVKSLHDKHEGKRTRPSLDEVSTTLCSVVALYSRTFVIIDALDEALFEDRDKFLAALSNLQQGGQAHLNILTTSRPEVASHFEEHFDGYIQQQIRAADNDVLSYIHGRLSTNRRPRLSKFPDLQGAIKRQVVKAADGMFLLAKLHMDYLLSKPTAGDVEDALTDIPHGSSGLDTLYHQAMERINNHKEGQRDITYKVLYWIVHVKRPLSIAELQHAVAVRPGATELKDKFLIEVEDLISDCAGLVTVDEESSIIRLIHHTTQEYFERTRMVWFPNAESEITRTCVTYLSFSLFESGICETREDFETRLRSNPFYDYAARHWGHHARDASTLHQEVIKFLEDKEKVEASGQALMAVRRYSGQSKQSRVIPRRMTGLHLAAYFGLSETVHTLLKYKQNPSLKDSYDRTPLSYAALRGYDAVVKLLLATEEVDADSKDKYGRTPLSYAAERGQVAVVKLLLTTEGVDADSKDKYFDQTPLSYAAERGHEAVVKLLLASKGVDADLKDARYGQTPLSHAAERGHDAVVKLLLATEEVDADSKDKYGRTPLSYATERGQVAVVKLLLATEGVDADSKDRYLGQTPLLCAVEKGHDSVVKLLLDSHRVNTNSKNDLGQTPLSYAADKGHEAVVRLLLDGGKHDANPKTHLDQALLSYAPCNDPRLGRNSDMNKELEVLPCVKLPTLPQCLAANVTWHGQVRCKPGQNNELIYFREKDQLADAMYYGKWEQVMALLTDKRMKYHQDWVNCWGNDLFARREGITAGFTALHQAAWWGDKEAAQKLVGMGAWRLARTIANTSNSKKYSTPLDVARDQEQVDLYEILKPVVKRDVNHETLHVLQDHLHRLIRQSFRGNPQDLECFILPQLEILTEFEDSKIWFPLNPELPGSTEQPGFHIILDGNDLVVIVQLDKGEPKNYRISLAGRQEI